MKWYIPTWHGDLRLIPGENAGHTMLTVEKPTAEERKIANRIGAECVRRGWIKEWDEVEAHKLFARAKNVLVEAPLEKVGPVVAKLMKPQDAVLTAITFKDGKVTTCSGTLAELESMAAEAAAAPPEKEATAAATVKRPTPSCPACIPGSIGPAREVLLAFLNEEEHASWAKDRTIVVTGGLSGCRYLLAHRHSRTAQKQGRICFDLDSGIVVHFHDWSVPPEEEVLAAKLILEHREPWLRNEATMLGAQIENGATVIDAEFRDGQPRGLRNEYFKNPFGDFFDGTWDSSVTQQFGRLFGVD